MLTYSTLPAIEINFKVTLNYFHEKLIIEARLIYRNFVKYTFTLTWRLLFLEILQTDTHNRALLGISGTDI